MEATQLSPTVAALLRSVEQTSVQQMIQLSPEERARLERVNDLIAPQGGDADE